MLHAIQFKSYYTTHTHTHTHTHTKQIALAGLLIIWSMQSDPILGPSVVNSCLDRSNWLEQLLIITAGHNVQSYTV